MTSLAIADGWTMTSGQRGGRGLGAWREVVLAWAVATVLAGALLVTVPNHDKEGSPARLWSLAPTAGAHLQQTAPDAEGPRSDEACSDRDYANERC